LKQGKNRIGSLVYDNFGEKTSDFGVAFENGYHVSCHNNRYTQSYANPGTHDLLPDKAYKIKEHQMHQLDLYYIEAWYRI
jgi:hypothetical protein